MISLSPFIPCVNEDDSFLAEVLFVGLVKNRLKPCLIVARKGVFEYVGIVLPSSRVVPGWHHTPETDKAGSLKLKVFEGNFPIVVDCALEVGVKDRRRVSLCTHSMGREFHGSIESEHSRINRCQRVFKRLHHRKINVTDAFLQGLFTPDFRGALDVREKISSVQQQKRSVVYADIIRVPKVADHIVNDRAIV